MTAAQVSAPWVRFAKSLFLPRRRRPRRGIEPDDGISLRMTPSPKLGTALTSHGVHDPRGELLFLRAGGCRRALARLPCGLNAFEIFDGAG